MENEDNKLIELDEPPKECVMCGENDFDTDPIEETFLMNGNEPKERIVGTFYTCTECGQIYEVYN